MPLRAIIFDFDGVLANSEPLHFLAFRDVLATEGVALTEIDYYEKYLGFDDAGAFRQIGAAGQRTWDARHVANLVAKKAERMEVLLSGVSEVPEFDKVADNVSVLFPGAADAVRRAAAAVPIAIASGALGAEIRHVLNREGLIDYFGAIVGAEDASKSKPAPDPYLRAIALLNANGGRRLEPGECVAIEDSLWGLESARAAGLRTVGVAHTYPADALTADWVIPSIADLDIALLRQSPY